MKKLFRLILVLIVVVIVAGVVAYLWIDSLVKAGVERGGTYALGVPTKVQDLHLGLLNGSLEMDGLNVANPQGFTSPHLMHSGRFQVEVVPGSILEDTIQVQRFELDGLDLHVEQKLPKSNVSVIIDNLKRLGGEKKEPEPAGEGKKVKVGKILIRNVVAHFHLPALKPIDVKVPRIELTEVTSDNAQGVAVSELVTRIVPAVIAAVLEQAQGAVPGDILGPLKGDLSSLTQALGGQVQKLTQDVQGEMRKALGEAGKTITDAAGKVLGKDANAVTGGIQKAVGGALEGVLGGKKDANQPAKKAGDLLKGLVGDKK